MDNVRYVSASFFTRVDIRSENFAERFFELLRKHGDALVPHEFDSGESTSEDRWMSFDPTFPHLVIREWRRSGSVLLRRKAPVKSQITADMLFLASGGFNNIAISVEERYLESPDHVAVFLDLSLALYDLMHPAYGYIHDIEDKLETRTEMDPKYGKIVIPTKLTKGLPGIYWANLLGPEYVAMLGREQLLSAPCFRLEELPDGGMLLLTSPSPLGLLSTDNLQARHKLRKYLGEDLFYPSQVVSTRVPKFKGAPSPRGADRDLLISFDAGKAERKAQARNFIDNAEDLASLLIDELANQDKVLDYSLGSLCILDQILLHKREAGEALDEFSAKMFAAYAGEVAKRALEGQWIVDEVTGEAALRIKDAKIYPLSRVFKFWESEERNAFATVFDIVGVVAKSEPLADRNQGDFGHSV